MSKRTKSRRSSIIVLLTLFAVGMPATSALSGGLPKISLPGAVEISDEKVEVLGVKINFKEEEGKKTLSYTNKDFNGHDFSGQSLAGATFTNCDFKDASFKGVDLRGAVFVNASMLNVDFSNACLVDAAFTNVDIYNGIFVGTNLTGVEFINTERLKSPTYKDAVFNSKECNVDKIKTSSRANVSVREVLSSHVKASEIEKQLGRGRNSDINLQVLFAQNSDKILKEAHVQVFEIAEALKSSVLKNDTIRLEGHTDNTGTIDYNEDLSYRRALSVKTELVNKYGIDSSRLIVKGFGSSQPIADNDTEESRAKNRRVRLVNLGKQ